ncbi:AIPR family protein [Bengtsoniella intestinalis]|uniref:AIPR family protein n=1 Tax=Bengtsoniella intestinalis TaxID=3073143 RepID=UPI00391F43AA
MTFKAEAFRKIPNPYLKADQGTQAAEMYFAICDIKNIPDNIPMQTNPREQKLTTGVAKKIKESLLNEEALDFYLLNRGLLLSAKSVTYNNYSNEITITFEDLDVHGNVDGGHTYKTILQNRDQLDFGQQYVKLEFLTGIESIFQSLAAARNTSVQIQDKSIAELEDRFEIIKSALAKESFMSSVFFKENDTGDIDVTDLLALLNMFNIDRYPGFDSFPTNSYSSKKKRIDLYIAAHKEFTETNGNPYVKMVNIMPDIFKLYNTIELKMGDFYKQKNPSGRYGSIKGVSMPRNGQVLKSKFMQDELDTMSPNGFIYPILGAFRALLAEKDGQYTWKCNPFSILEKVGPDLVDSTVQMSRALGNNPQSVGKDINIWKTLYMTVAFSAMS